MPNKSVTHLLNEAHCVMKRRQSSSGEIVSNDKISDLDHLRGRCGNTPLHINVVFLSTLR